MSDYESDSYSDSDGDDHGYGSDYHNDDQDDSDSFASDANTYDEDEDIFVYVIVANIIHVQQISSRTKSITIHSETPILQSHLVECLGLLKERIRLLQGEAQKSLKLKSIVFNGSSRTKTLIEPLAWDTLADLVISIPSLALSFSGQFRSSDLPPSFVLRLRQYAFDLQLDFDEDDNPDSFLSLLFEQAHRLHSPSICPFAIRSLGFNSFSIGTIASFVRLGRAGPEEVTFDGRSTLEWRKDIVATLVALMERNLWLVWDNEGCGISFVKPRAKGEEEPADDAALDRAKLELDDRLRTLNQRNRELRETTRAAATALLRAARPLFSALPLPLPTCVASSSPSSPNLTSVPSQLPSLSLPLSQNQNHPPSLTAASRFPPNFSSLLSSTSFPSILSLPYEILDLILSHLSPGHLSFNQHRLVMNWAEDRATLGARKADSRTDFLRKTNCWRWESEIERVNMGLGYE